MLSEEEKIQKAEEIYYRRNGVNYRNIEKPKEKKHTLAKILILLVIIGAGLGYKNKEYLMSEEFKNQAKNFLNTKIDIQNIIKANNIQETNKQEEIVQEKEVIDETKTTSVIWPYKGIITSNFGERESEDSRVTANHTGIDIAGNIGDKIVSAIEGKVTQVSTEGDLGNHIKIENDEYTTVYAHCNKIYLQEGMQVKQGDEIAEIGSTGNSTGAHLHFEIIKQGEYIDPLTILEQVGEE